MEILRAKQKGRLLCTYTFAGTSTLWFGVSLEVRKGKQGRKR
jgi:hypothetical protein